MDVIHQRICSALIAIISETRAPLFLPFFRVKRMAHILPPPPFPSHQADEGETRRQLCGHVSPSTGASAVVDSSAPSKKISSFCPVQHWAPFVTGPSEIRPPRTDGQSIENGKRWSWLDSLINTDDRVITVNFRKLTSNENGPHRPLPSILSNHWKPVKGDGLMGALFPTSDEPAGHYEEEEEEGVEDETTALG